MDNWAVLPDNGLLTRVLEDELRGRGGAGFPAGVKWGFVPKDSAKPKYVVCNADESEPGTFNNRILMEEDPHQLLEGIAITCHAVRSHTAYIYLRYEYGRSSRVLRYFQRHGYARSYCAERAGLSLRAS